MLSSEVQRQFNDTIREYNHRSPICTQRAQAKPVCRGGARTRSNAEKNAPSRNTLRSESATSGAIIITVTVDFHARAIISPTC